MTDASWRWLTGEVGTALDGFVSALDGLDGATKVPNLDWTVAELAAHLASLPRLYRSQDEVGPDFERPDDFARFSVEQRAHLDTSDLNSVADVVRSEIGGLITQIEATGDPDGSRWLYGQATTHRNVAGSVLAELIIHAQDLAPLSGSRPTLSRPQAMAGLHGAFAIMPAFIDRQKAARAAGVYHLWFRGGEHWAYRIAADGGFVVEAGRPDRADVHLWADPATFLLIGLGRRNETLAALTGKLVVWGRRPWKILATSDITVDGI